MLLERRRVLSYLEPNTRESPGRGRLHTFSGGGQIPMIVILIVITLLAFLCIPDSVINAARRGRSNSQHSHPQAKH